MKIRATSHNDERGYKDSVNGDPMEIGWRLNRANGCKRADGDKSDMAAEKLTYPFWDGWSVVILALQPPSIPLTSSAMSEQELNAPSANRAATVEDREMTRTIAKAFSVVNSLDKSIREAGRLDRTACDGVEVLAPIAEFTVSLLRYVQER